MNPEKPSRDEIETKLTALLLGELPAEEAALLRWAIAQDAGLAALHERLKQTIGLVREVAAHPAETPAEVAALKLSGVRREKLLAHFQTPRHQPLLPPLPTRTESFWTRRRAALSPLVTIAAVLAVVAVLAGLMLPVLSKAKSKAQTVALRSEAMQRAPRVPMEAESAAGPQTAAAPPPPVSPPTAIVLPQVADGNLDTITTENAKPEGERSAQHSLGGLGYDANAVGYNNLDSAKATPVAPGGNVTVNFSDAVSGGWKSDGGELAQVPPPPARALVSEALPVATTAPLAIKGVDAPSEPISPVKNAEVGRQVMGFYDYSHVLADRESGDKNGRLPVSNNQWNGTHAINWDEKELGGSGGGGGSGGRGPGNDLGAKAPGQLAQAKGSSTPSDRVQLTKDFVGEPQNKPAKEGADYYSGLARPSDPQPNPDTPAADAKGRAYEADEQKPPAEFASQFNYDISGSALAIGRSDVSDGRQEASLPSSRPQAKLSLPPTSGPASAEELPVLEKVYREGLTISVTESKKELESKDKQVPLQIELPAPLVVSTPMPVRLPGVSSELEVARKLEDKLATDADGDRIPVLGDMPVTGALFANKNNSVGPADELKHRMKVAGVISGVAGVTRNDDSGAYYRLPTNAASLAKSGSGTFTLAGENTYAGGTTISAGTLKNVGTADLDHVSAKRLKQDDREGQGVPSTINISGTSTIIADPPAPKVAVPAPVPQPEILTRSNAFSTFSLNVSDVSFKLAAASLEQGVLPEAASIRSEEFINAFDYRDPEAAAGQPLTFAAERARYPFAHNRDLLRFSVKTAAAGRAAGRALNLVLLLDNSGSMERADRVAIIREALRVLAVQLQPQDTVSVVTFARTARLWADGVRGDQAGKTLAQVSDITPEGGTNLEEAMRLAYGTAQRHYRATGMNRVVLLTDGAANLGDVNPAALKEKVEAFRKQGIALDCFGIGSQDFNDDLLEQLSRNGDGRYAFLNSPAEASTEFAAKIAGALQVAASDVKVQVEFNPQRVTAYRQIGYAKHQLTKEQFRDNTVDAAEIAAQEAGNALYTIETRADGVGPIATVRVRYKVPGTTDYRETSWEVAYTGGAAALEQSSPALRLAATASAFSEWLAGSPFGQEVTPDALLKISRGLPEVYGADVRPTKLEGMIRQAKSLAGK